MCCNKYHNEKLSEIGLRSLALPMLIKILLNFTPFQGVYIHVSSHKLPQITMSDPYPQSSFSQNNMGEVGQVMFSPFSELSQPCKHSPS